MSGLAMLFCAALGALLLMVFGAVALGAASSWLLGGEFVTGWAAAWGRPWVLLGWSVLFIGSAGATSVSRQS